MAKLSLFKASPFGSGLRKFALDPVLVDPTLVILLTFFLKKMTGSSANFLSPKSNGQGFSFLILSPHHPKNVVKSFMHKIKGTEDKVDQYVTF